MDQDLHTLLRELLEEGRQLGISRGGEDNIVARYAARIEQMPNPHEEEVAKLKRQLAKVRKEAEALEAAARQQQEAAKAAKAEKRAP